MEGLWPFNKESFTCIKHYNNITMLEILTYNMYTD